MPGMFDDLIPASPPASASGGMFDDLIPKRGGFSDFFSSIPRGLVRGLAGTAAASGQAEAGVMGMQGVPGAEESADIAEKEITGPLPKPEGRAGRVGAAIGTALGTPTTYLGPGGMAGKMATGVTSAIGGELGGEAGGRPGAVLGAVAGGMAPRGLARAITPNPISAERQAAVGELRQRGIEPTAGDVTGSRVVRHAEEMGDHPLGGGTYSALKDQAGRQLSAAALERMGEKADLASPEVIRRARDRIGDSLERVAKQLPINHDARLGNDLVKIEQDLAREGLPPATMDRVHAQVQNVLDGFVTGTKSGTTRGVMTGTTYQGLTRSNTPLARAIDDADPNISYYATRVRSALDDAMERSANARGTRPGVGRRQALDDLREARRQWYNMLVISKSVAGPGEAAAEGMISPQKLRQNLTNSPDNKLAYAAGRGDLHDLTRAANQVMTPLRSSGTTERAVAHGIPAAIGAGVGHLMTGEPVTGGLAGASVGPGLTGRAVNSRPVQGYLKNQQMTPHLSSVPGGAPQAARGAAIGGLLAPGSDDPTAAHNGPQSSIWDALSPVSTAHAMEPFQPKTKLADEALADKPTHGGALALPELGGGRLPAPQGKMGSTSVPGTYAQPRYNEMKTVGDWARDQKVEKIPDSKVEILPPGKAAVEVTSKVVPPPERLPEPPKMSRKVPPNFKESKIDETKLIRTSDYPVSKIREKAWGRPDEVDVLVKHLDYLTHTRFFDEMPGKWIKVPGWAQEIKYTRDRLGELGNEGQLVRGLEKAVNNKNRLESNQ